MKDVLVPLLVLGFLLGGISTLLAGAPTTVTIDVIQDQCRYYPNGEVYHDHAPFPTQFVLRLSANVLHGEMEYSPLVEPVRAYRFMLVNRGEVEGGNHWELRMGSTHYPSYYCPWLLIDEYWEGYLILDESFNLVEGKFKQIGYTSVSPEATDCSKYSPFATKGIAPKHGLWCLGWSIYDYYPSL